MALAIGQYVEGLRARRLKQQARRALAVDAVRAELPRVSSLLREKYGVARAVLFGSFARGDAREDSDVDLLVEGLYFFRNRQPRCGVSAGSQLLRPHR